MITKLSSSVNGIQLGFQYEGFEISKDGKYARVTKPRIILISDANAVNHNNILCVSGSVIVKQKDHTINVYRNVRCSGTGKKVIKRLTGEWVLLKAESKTKKAVYARIDWLDNSIELLRYISYPEAK